MKYIWKFVQASVKPEQILKCIFLLLPAAPCVPGPSLKLSTIHAVHTIGLQPSHCCTQPTHRCSWPQAHQVNKIFIIIMHNMDYCVTCYYCIGIEKSKLLQALTPAHWWESSNSDKTWSSQMTLRTVTCQYDAVQYIKHDTALKRLSLHKWEFLLTKDTPHLSFTRENCTVPFIHGENYELSASLV